MKELTDTQMLNWCEKNVTAISQKMNCEFCVNYLDDTGQQVVFGGSLRDCIKKAYYE